MAPEAPRGGNTSTPRGKTKNQKRSLENVDSNEMDQKAPKKRSNAGKNWCLTWWNFPDDWREKFQKNKKIDAYVVGREQGAEGGWHLQGYIEFEKKQRPIECLKWDKKIHWEAAEGTAWDNYKYCTKGGDFIVNNIDEPYIIDLTLRPWQEKVWAWLQQKPDDRTVHWVWEPLGNSGKTTFMKYVYQNMKHVCIGAPKASDTKHLILKYMQEKKRVPKIVFIDLPRGTKMEYFSWSGIETVKNMFFASGKYEGGFVCERPVHLVIFANQPPDTMKLSEDRWSIWKIVDGDLDRW